MSDILSAIDLKNGKEPYKQPTTLFSRPLQVLPRAEKDDTWKKMNMDWLEMYGMNQIRQQAKRMISNYKMAYGIIEKEDYIPSETNEYSELLTAIEDDDISVANIKNYPIAKTIINVLLSEFAKRSTDVYYYAVDDETKNEILEKKMMDIENVLLDDLNNKIKLQLLSFEGKEDSEEYKQLSQIVNNREALRKLPEIEEFYRKTYRTIYEQWAEKQHEIDIERFRMYELETEAFLDLLTVNREIWHFNMLEDDYEIELWDTVTTFYHRSPGEKYLSNCSFVGNIQLLTLSEVIDKYAIYLTEEEIKSLEKIFPITGAKYALSNLQNDGSYYDKNLSYEDNVGGPSLNMRRFMFMFGYDGHPTFDMLLNNEDASFNKVPYLRVTTAYWVSYKKVGLLTKIDELGNTTQAVVTEDYKITTKPVYNKKLLNEESEKTLIYGEHIEWLWIKEVWGGRKIGLNSVMLYGNSGFSPIYIGINSREIKPLPFQFKGDYSLFGAKLPVEGIVDNYKYAHSMSLIDLLKPYQIGYNIVNNQIADILLDEIGTVIVLDQNTLPKHSLGEDWGDSPFEYAYVAMKNFNILPLDTSIRNTETSINFNHMQKLDLEQTNRLLSRVNLAQYFKREAYETIGITPQRLGQPIGQKQTATEVENSVVSSFSQTETYFITHCDYVMPRVHQMRTQLAQYYVSKNPSFRLRLSMKNYERVFFSIDGTKLLNKDINVFVTTRADYRAIIEQLKRTMINSNAATIYDLADILQIKNYNELKQKIDEIRQRSMQEMQMKYEQEMQMKQMEYEEHLKQLQLEQDFKAREAEKERRKDILVAQIKAAGYMAPFDKDNNMRSDYIDFLEKLNVDQKEEEINELKKKTYENKNRIAEEKLKLMKEQQESKKFDKLIDLEIAKENKNKYDVEDK